MNLTDDDILAELPWLRHWASLPTSSHHGRLLNIPPVADMRAMFSARRHHADQRTFIGVSPLIGTPPSLLKRLEQFSDDVTQKPCPTLSALNFGQRGLLKSTQSVVNISERAEWFDASTRTQSMVPLMSEDGLREFHCYTIGALLTASSANVGNHFEMVKTKGDTVGGHIMNACLVTMKTPPVSSQSMIPPLSTTELEHYICTSSSPNGARGGIVTCLSQGVIVSCNNRSFSRLLGKHLSAHDITGSTWDVASDRAKDHARAMLCAHHGGPEMIQVNGEGWEVDSGRLLHYLSLAYDEKIKSRNDCPEMSPTVQITLARGLWVCINTGPGRLLKYVASADMWLSSSELSMHHYREASTLSSLLFHLPYVALSTPPRLNTGISLLRSAINSSRSSIPMLVEPRQSDRMRESILSDCETWLRVALVPHDESVCDQIAVARERANKCGLNLIDEREVMWPDHLPAPIIGDVVPCWSVEPLSLISADNCTVIDVTVVERANKLMCTQVRVQFLSVPTSGLKLGSIFGFKGCIKLVDDDTFPLQIGGQDDGKPACDAAIPMNLLLDKRLYGMLARAMSITMEIDHGETELLTMDEMLNRSEMFDKEVRWNGDIVNCMILCMPFMLLSQRPTSMSKVSFRHDPAMRRRDGSGGSFRFGVMECNAMMGLGYSTLLQHAWDASDLTLLPICDTCKMPHSLCGSRDERNAVTNVVCPSTLVKEVELVSASNDVRFEFGT